MTHHGRHQCFAAVTLISNQKGSAMVPGAGWILQSVDMPSVPRLLFPLTKQRKKGTPVQLCWTLEAEEAFNNLLEALLCQNMVSQTPSAGRTFVMQRDASEIWIGMVLIQEGEDGEYPLQYLSWKLSKAERKYEVKKQKALMKKITVDSLQYYLWGTSFMLIPDHAPLVWLQCIKDTRSYISIQLAHWH